jgi:microcystin-dependent protein
MNNVFLSQSGIICDNCNIDVSGTGLIYTNAPELSDYSNKVPTTKWIIDYINNNNNNNVTSIPIGSIIMWNGDIPPINWALCDGIGTYIDYYNNIVPIPELSGKFILCYKQNINNIEDIGGESSVTLNIDEIPAHSHNFTYNSTKRGGDSTKAIKQLATANYDYNLTTSLTGGSKSHNNMPPYYILAYIIKIK